MIVQRWLSIAEVTIPEGAPRPDVTFHRCSVEFHRFFPVAIETRGSESDSALPIAATRSRAFLELIMVTAAQRYRIAISEFLGRSRYQAYRDCRRVAFYAARTLARASYPEIGRAFHRHHTTILDSLQETESLLQADPKGPLAKEIQQFSAEVLAAARGAERKEAASA